MHVNHLLRLAALFVLSCSLAAVLHASEATPEQLLATLLSPDTSNEQWSSTADSFHKLPPELAIRILYPEIAKGIPGGWSYAAYNCSAPSTDRHVPAWGRFCVANWLWCNAISCGRGDYKVAATLLELWAHPQSTYGQSVLLGALDFGNWVPEAEEPVRKLFSDSEATPSLRKQAASCLLHHLGAKYHRDVVEFALFSNRQTRDLFFRELASPPHARVSGIDPAVVRLGFWLFLEELTAIEEHSARHTSTASYYGAFLPANLLGDYLGQEFTPDQKLQKYLGEQGRELWYRDTVGNAFNWWLRNREYYAK